MTPEAATLVLAVADHLPRKLKVADARRVVQAWLRAIGKIEDRWGNFANVVSDQERGHDIVASRYHFTDRQLQRQVKYRDDNDWRNRSSTALIDAAHIAITGAAKALGRTELIERLDATHAEREHAVEKRESARDRKATAAKGREIATKYLAKKYRADVLKNYAGETIDPDRLAEMKQVLEFQSGFFASVKTQPTDEAFASVDQPPFLPVFGPMVYEWIERVGDVDYTIRVTNKAKHKATITIGTSGMVSVDPYTLIAKPSTSHGAKGDGVISGTLMWDPEAPRPGKFIAGLILISVKGEKRSGAGTRLLSLWCRMMAGYGIARWVAVGVGAEGAAFFNALARRGVINVDGKRATSQSHDASNERAAGGNWVISCRGEPPRANPGPSVVDGWWG